MVHISVQDYELLEALLPMTFFVFLLSFFASNLLMRVMPLSRRANWIIIGVVIVGGAIALYVGLYGLPSEDISLQGSSCSVYTRPPTPSGTRVKLITFADAKSEALADLSERINKLYVAHFPGYVFARYTGCFPRRRALQWTKIVLLHEELQGNDAEVAEWTVWLDADAALVNFTYDLYGNFLSVLDKKTLLVVATDIPEWGRPINTGFMAVRRGEGSRRLLEEIWTNGPRLHLRYNWFHEQGTLTHLVKTVPIIAEQVLVVARPYWSSDDVPGISMYVQESLLSGNFGKEPYIWRPGHVVAHCIGPRSGGTNKRKCLLELTDYVLAQIKENEKN